MRFITPRKALLSLAVVATTAASLTLVASPAIADEPASQYCWQNIDTGSTQCFADEDTLEAALESQTRTVLAEPGVSARGMAAVATSYRLATWYEDTNYGGDYLLTTSINSAACTSGTVNLNFSAAWNNRVSSYKTWYGCSGLLFANIGQAGASFGPSTAASSVGALNDAASSYRLT